MQKFLFLLVAVVFVAMGITGVGYAAPGDVGEIRPGGSGEQITLTTYYPSPYGVYKTLRLYPNADAQLISGGSCQNAGEMAYDQDTDAILFCRKMSETEKKWQALGGGDSLWVRKQGQSADREAIIPVSDVDHVLIGQPDDGADFRPYYLAQLVVSGASAGRAGLIEIRSAGEGDGNDLDVQSALVLQNQAGNHHLSFRYRDEGTAWQHDMLDMVFWDMSALPDKKMYRGLTVLRGGILLPDRQDNVAGTGPNAVALPLNAPAGTIRYNSSFGTLQVRILKADGTMAWRNVILDTVDRPE